MSYQVLARKWRPKTFDEVVGQATVTRTLRNALASGRIGHAFLLSGARGVGKTTTARILAKALNCSRGEGSTPDPCGSCSSCTEIAAGTSLDVQEIDGATHNGVEQVRELRESARYSPARDRFKIWIIDEVHMLSTGAFNALLKTLEEPPPRVKFIFATTEYHKIPDTILSRCQQYDLRMVPTRELVDHLRAVANGEGIKVSSDALLRIARAAEGSVRDALSLFDQVLSFSGEAVRDEDIAALLGLIDRELLLSASRAVATQNSLAVLELVERLSDYGADHRSFARELLLHFRDILLLKMAPEGSALLSQIAPEERESVAKLAEEYSEEDLLRALDVLTRAEAELRWAQDPRVTLELALLKMVQMKRLLPFTELVARVEGLSGSSHQAPAKTSGAVEGPSGLRIPSVVAATQEFRGQAQESILASLVRLAQARPSLLQPLRGARAQVHGDVLVIEVPPDFLAFAETHLEEYQDLARRAADRPLKVRITADRAGSEVATTSPAVLKRERLLKEAAREPAVQEALDLFNGKIVGVREAKSAKESV